MKTPIPERMAHLKIDARGYPIPYGVVIDREGVVHFAINDEGIRIKSIAKGLCSICGTKLFRGRWFIGGALSAFHTDGGFIDPPMHNECAHYALEVCPYLAAPRYAGEIGKLKAKQNAKGLAGVQLIDNTMIDGRPAGDMFIALMTTGTVLTCPETFNLKPIPPFSRVEYWRHGKRLADAEGHALAMKAVMEFEPV